MDPVQLGISVPFTEEWFHTQKKLLKQSEASKTALGEASDVYTPSEAAQQLPSTPQEKFLAEAKSEISKMDPTSENFMSEATSALVGSALGQAFGEEICYNPGYPQMNAKITQKLLNDYGEVIGDFLNALVESEYRRLEQGAEMDTERLEQFGLNGSDEIEGISE